MRALEFGGKFLEALTFDPTLLGAPSRSEPLRIEARIRLAGSNNPGRRHQPRPQHVCWSATKVTPFLRGGTPVVVVEGLLRDREEQPSSCRPRRSAWTRSRALSGFPPSPGGAAGLPLGAGAPPSPARTRFEHLSAAPVWGGARRGPCKALARLRAVDSGKWQPHQPVCASICGWRLEGRCSQGRLMMLAVRSRLHNRRIGRADSMIGRRAAGGPKARSRLCRSGPARTAL
jgi:hypothetical protein